MAGTAGKIQVDDNVIIDLNLKDPEGNSVKESVWKAGEKAEDLKMKGTEGRGLPMKEHSLLEDRGDSHKSTCEGEKRTEKGRKTRKHSGCGVGPADMERDPITESVKQKLKAHVREKFTCIYEGTSANQTRLENVFTRLYVTEQIHDCGFKTHEILEQFKLPYETSPFSELEYEEITCLNIFKPRTNIPHQQDRSIKRVMTKGIAGIGKTVTVQNFSLNWAEGKSNQHIDFIFVLPFRELNMLKEGEYNLLQLLLHFYPELKLLEDIQQLVSKQVLFIFDGLDESRFPLDFEGGMTVSDIVQPSTVDVLLTNLIKGNLLPNALLWITSRPAAVSQIPSKYIDQMTEVQGFTDQQREEYFKKKFSSDEVLSRLRGMISFYFMGHIPVFCWITAEVFKEEWSDQRSRTITTMTELYIHYLLIQIQRTTQKYGKKSWKAKKKTSESGNAAMLLNLSKLAFEQLQKGNIIFYEEDLQECGIDVNKASMFCGFCSEILKQERGLYQKKMFSFVHLSFQEFLAALYVFHCCVTKNISILKSFLDVDPTDLSLLELQRRVVDKALQSEKGQLDLFLCFFLGFSLESNQTMLQRLLPQTKSSSDTVEEMKKYLKNLQLGDIPQERCMNLFLCKFELKEERFQDDIRMYLDSGVILSPIDFSVLSTLLQISGELLDELDLTKCYTLAGGVEKLLLLMKHCKKAALKSEHLFNTEKILLSTLQSSDSHLRELRLVNLHKHLPDTLFHALGSPDCKLETLRLSGFAADSNHCHTLASILQLKQSSLRVLDLTDCVYSYSRVLSGYYFQEKKKKKKKKKKQKYEDVNDEFSRLTIIPAALIGPVCKLVELSMSGCYLKSKCCQVFASVLCSDSQLRELDLSRNDLQDLGVQLLSVGLGSSKCRLETLRLSCCGITEEGCAFLASALRSNPSHLRELDLSYNHPGEAGVRLLRERLEDPGCRMEKLNVDHDEEHWVNPQLLNKYACDLTLDPNTVHEELLLSECNRTVSYTKEKQQYPDHPERFDGGQQVLCRENLTGRCYWEVECNGYAYIGVAYKSLERKGWWDPMYRSKKAWCFNINNSYGNTFHHAHSETFIPAPFIDVQAYLVRQMRLGLFLDWPAGILSFYSLSGDKKMLLYTFHTTFTEPLHPAFSVGGSLTLSSVAKLKMDSEKLSFTPVVTKESIGISYRYTFPSSGLFHCSLTGLVFNATHEGEVKYNTCLWDRMPIQPSHKVPGGPLFNIECPQESISQLHLPHCEPEPALVADSISVVHITDDGMTIIKPREITDTHVVVDTPHLSAYGIVRDLIKRFKNLKPPIHAQILLFLRSLYRGGQLILSVILLPGNVPLQEVKAQYEECEYIKAPSNCLLHKAQQYSLHSNPDDCEIQPDTFQFFANYGPNYHASFEIIVTTNTVVTLMVKDPEKTHAWEYKLHVPDIFPQSPPAEKPKPVNTSAEGKLRNVRAHFIARVSDPVLDQMLDDLLSREVLNDFECEAVRALPRKDKARELIDTVHRKGTEASAAMISVFSISDPYLSRDLCLT